MLKKMKFNSFISNISAVLIFILLSGTAGNAMTILEMYRQKFPQPVRVVPHASDQGLTADDMNLHDLDFDTITKNENGRRLTYETAKVWGLVLNEAPLDIIESGSSDSREALTRPVRQFTVSGQDGQEATKCELYQRNLVGNEQLQQFNKEWFNEAPVVFPKKVKNRRSQGTALKHPYLDNSSILSVEKIVPYADERSLEYVLSHRSGLYYSVLCTFPARNTKSRRADGKKVVHVRLGFIKDVFSSFNFALHHSFSKPRIAQKPQKPLEVSKPQKAPSLSSPITPLDPEDVLISKKTKRPLSLPLGFGNYSLPRQSVPLAEDSLVESLTPATDLTPNGQAPSALTAPVETPVQ